MRIENQLLKDRTTRLQNTLQDKENAQVDLINKLQEEVAIRKQIDLSLASNNKDYVPTFTNLIDKLQFQKQELQESKQAEAIFFKAQI